VRNKIDWGTIERCGSNRVCMGVLEIQVEEAKAVCLLAGTLSVIV
jgi:hypothetical protein